MAVRRGGNERQDAGGFLRWSACWWIASPHWGKPAWRSWIVSPRTGAGAASFRWHSTLQECRCEAEKAVHDLRTQLDTDPGAASRKQAAARRRATEDRERRVRAALAVTVELHAKQQEAACREAERAAKRAPQDAAADANGEEPASKKPREKEPRASTTDAQARVMKMADGGFRPAYNVQFATDTKSTAIAGVSVDNIGSDMGKMLPMNDALAGQYGTRPRQHLADGGFASSTTSKPWPRTASRPSCRCRSRATPIGTAMPRNPAIRRAWPTGETVWAVTTPRRSTRSGPRPRSAPTPKHVIAG